MQISGATRTRTAWILASTPIVLLLTHYAAVLPHEYMHSIVAWILGIKANPLIIRWGGSSVLNVLLLVNIDEMVNYTAALAAGKHWQVAAVAFAGPGLANGGLYLLSRWFIRSRYISARPFAAYVLFWFLFINLANLYDYVPLRVFASDADVDHFRLGSGVSPWVIYAIAGYLVLWALIDCYRVVLPHIFRVCGLVSRESRAAILILATALMFGYFAIPGLLESDVASLLIARTSVLAIPLIVAIAWRRTVATDASMAPSIAPSPASEASSLSRPGP